MEILKLKPACKDYIWGGRRLIEEYGKEFDGPRLAETWELSCHPDGPSVIAGGEFDGRTLREYLHVRGRRALGTSCQVFDRFPILIKFIDAKGPLSVQVHPGNTDALENEGEYGKTEMWYVLDAGPDAYLYYGFKEPVTKAEFRRRIEEDTLLEVLNRVSVHKGDCFYIPAGTLHAIGGDMVIAEIQQNSNVTYRVYDYGRVGADGRPRPLHIDQAVACTRLTPPRTDFPFAPHLVRCPYFTADTAAAPCTLESTEESFVSVLILEGTGTVQGGKTVVQCEKGDSLFLPAGAGLFSLTGTLRALVTTVGTI